MEWNFEIHIRFEKDVRKWCTIWRRIQQGRLDSFEGIQLIKATNVPTNRFISLQPRNSSHDVLEVHQINWFPDFKGRSGTGNLPKKMCRHIFIWRLQRFSLCWKLSNILFFAITWLTFNMARNDILHCIGWYTNSFQYCFCFQFTFFRNMKSNCLSLDGLFVPFGPFSNMFGARVSYLLPVSFLQFFFAYISAFISLSLIKGWKRLFEISRQRNILLLNYDTKGFPPELFTSQKIVCWHEKTQMIACNNDNKKSGGWHLCPERMLLIS